MSAPRLVLSPADKQVLDAGFAAAFGAEPQRYFSAPGRTEIGGNHTDHQRGRVVAAAVNLDTRAAVRLNGTNVIRILSKGYPLCEVALDQSAFYPTSGGQPYDTGTLGNVRVVDVTVEDNVVWHRLDGALRVGDSVHGEIDWPRRFDHMQQHGADHVLAGACYELFGGVTIGLHLGEEVSSIDMTLPGGRTHLTEAEVDQLETLVNERIQRDAPVRCWFPGEEELSSLPLRKKPTVTEHVRIVAFGDYEMVPASRRSG